ncbi:MAG: signal recognition particle-docking protein FtsY, partial [Syntrophales bacterium]|nr:signal recognition particle-docking protein FtsY [Syntrophales bacterium]
ISGEKVVSRDIFEDLEEILIAADLGPSFTFDLIEDMKERAKRKELQNPESLKKIMVDNMTAILKQSESPIVLPSNKIFTIMVIGVNGTGKTTTIGKLAAFFKQQNASVLFAAADTFRAAAIEQLEIWSKRTETPLIKQAMGADPSAVVYDSIKAAKARNTDVLIVDTAGRLHTKTNLMDELKKIKRVMGKELPGAPHEILLVLDATTGQNALMQAQMFNAEIGISGLVLTKLDGTAKGGIVVRIAKEMKTPIRFIGVGEKIDDLRPFNGREFVEALFAES